MSCGSGRLGLSVNKYNEMYAGSYVHCSYHVGFYSHIWFLRRIDLKCQPNWNHDWYPKRFPYHMMFVSFNTNTTRTTSVQKLLTLPKHMSQPPCYVGSYCSSLGFPRLFFWLRLRYHQTFHIVIMKIIYSRKIILI